MSVNFSNHNPRTSQTDRQTDRQTRGIYQYRAMQLAVSAPPPDTYVFGPTRVHTPNVHLDRFSRFCRVAAHGRSRDSFSGFWDSLYILERVQIAPVYWVGLRQVRSSGWRI